MKNQCTVGILDVDKLEITLNEPWELEDRINEYLNKMTWKQEWLRVAGITISDEQMAIKT